MSLLEKALQRRKLVVTLAILLSLTGVLSWITMVRQEDPRLPDYWGQIIVAFPGAEAEQVERLVLEPVEEHLAEVEEIHWIESTAFAEMAVLFLELREDVSDTQEAWDDVREALTDARRELPDGTGEPVLNDEVGGEQESVVLALTGSPDPLRLLAAARRLERHLLALPQVALVHIVADPGEQVTIELDDVVSRSLGLSAPQVAEQLSARNQILPGGSVRLGSKTVSLRPLSDFQSVAEIASTPILLPSGSSVPLAEVADVRLGPREPAAARMRFGGEMAVGLGVVAKQGTDLVSYGHAVRELISDLRPSFEGIEIHEVAFQPRRVSSRIDQLSRSLLLGIVIVAGVVVLAMGVRLGLLVASVVPLVAMSALAVYGFGGGVLHQMSIAALVLALGILVDNAIVMAENVQWRLDHGDTPREAAAASVRELAVPLAAATATTLAAFVPMLLADGSTAAFTRAIPVVIMLTLTVSFLFAVLVTPVAAERFLTPGGTRTGGISHRLGRSLAALSTGRPILVLMTAAMLVGASLAASMWVKRQFFPAADRNQLVVDLKLPEGTHLDTTDSSARLLENALLKRPDVNRVASFMGRSTPKFYYNLNRVPWSPHFAQIVVETARTEDVAAVIDTVQEVAAKRLPGAEVVARRLEQGPPVDAPVEIRLYGDNLEDLYQASASVAAELRRIPGTSNIRHDLSPGAPTLRFRVNDAAAARHGLSRVQVAQALYGMSRGLPVGEMRATEDPIPVVIRSSAGEATSAEDLEAIAVARPAGGTVPLAQVAQVSAEWRPAAIKHRDRQRVATVSSQLEDGITFSDVLAEFEQRRATLELPAGVSLGYGGDAEGAGQANTAMLRTLPIGVMLLLGVLLAEFNSFRRVAIVLTTVPLAAAGVVPGLLIGGQPFGFMSMLGVIALVGIVVNNAIVLLEVVESRRRDGASVNAALADAVQQRIRPILLTTATTVAGLLPLALSPSTLWPPLASAMISGLLASTMLTLVVVPALYRVLFGEALHLRQRFPRFAPQAAAVVAVGLTIVPGLAADTLSLEESMRRAADRPAAAAALDRARAADEAGRAERRTSYLPTLGASFSMSDRNRDLALTTPIGELELGASRNNSAGIELVQPLLDPVRIFYANPASRAEAEAVRLEGARLRQELAAEAGRAHLLVLELEARIQSTIAFEKSLESRLAEVDAMVEAGRALEADSLKIRLALERAQLERTALQNNHSTAVTDLGRKVGRGGPVTALPSPDWQDRAIPAAEVLVTSAMLGRDDLEALEHVAEGLDLRRAAVKAEALPRLDASLSWTWTDGSPYSVDSWAEGALTLSWSVFAAGTLAPRARAFEAQRDAVEHDLDEARRAASLQIRSTLATLDTARNAVQVSARGVEQATENLRVERERHTAGRTTTNDLLIAEAELREQRTLYEIARIEVVRSWIELWLASGEDALGLLFG